MVFYLSYLSLAIWVYLLFFYSRQGQKIENPFWTNKIVFENFFLSKKEIHLDKVSLCVVIPARNEAANILTTLDSILKQNFKKKYILIVDDNSTDKTGEISKIFLKKK